jgi:hypothetical protein
MGMLFVMGFANSAVADPAKPSSEQITAEIRTQRQFATNAYLADLHRAQKVTYALIKAGAPYCEQRRKYSMGIPPLAESDLPQSLREGFADTQQASSAGKLPVFLNIAWDSPASEAGVQTGDVLLQMLDRANGQLLQPGWTLNRPANTLVANEQVSIRVKRGDLTKSLSALPQLVCDMQLQLLRSNDLIVKADVGVVSLSQGLLRFLPNDDELAYLLANELIHEQLRFARTSQTKSPAKKGTDRLRPEDEQEADYLGAYLTVSAQFDLARAQNVWRRIASIPPDQNKDGFATRHPLPPLRGAQIQAVSDEIRHKALTGARLTPDRHFSLTFAEADFRARPAHEKNSSTASVAQEDPRLRVLTNIPYVNNEGLVGYQRFLASPLRPRAFAIGPSKTATRGAWSFKFGTNAAADALAQCATFARGPCYLYAINDQVVWNPETALDQPQISSSGLANTLAAQPRGTGFAAINDIAAVPLPDSEAPAYRAFLEKPSPRAFLITQDGQGLYWLGPAATHDALAYCARLGAPCWLYAVNTEVVWSAEIGKRISRLDQLPSQNAESGFLEN